MESKAWKLPWGPTASYEETVSPRRSTTSSLPSYTSKIRIRLLLTYPKKTVSRRPSSSLKSTRTPIKTRVNVKETCPCRPQSPSAAMPTPPSCPPVSWWPSSTLKSTRTPTKTRINAGVARPSRPQRRSLAMSTPPSRPPMRPLWMRSNEARNRRSTAAKKSIQDRQKQSVTHSLESLIYQGSQKSSWSRWMRQRLWCAVQSECGWAMVDNQTGLSDWNKCCRPARK